MEIQKNKKTEILVSLRPNSFENKLFKHVKKIFNLKNPKTEVIFSFMDVYKEQKELIEMKEKGLKIEFVNQNKIDKNFDYIFIFGGDGSILWTSKFTGCLNKDTIVFTFNMGHIGFLNQYTLKKIDKVINKLKNFFEEEKNIDFPFKIQKVPKLQATINSSQKKTKKKLLKL